MKYTGLINLNPVISSSYFVRQYHCTLCERFQKQLFRNIHKLFPYVLYNIKYDPIKYFWYLLVIFYSGRCPISLIVTYSMISAYYALFFGKKLFSNLLFHRILLFRLHLRIHANYLVIHLQKCTFAKFKVD